MTRGQQIAKQVRKQMFREKMVGVLVDLTIIALIAGVVVAVISNFGL